MSHQDSAPSTTHDEEEAVEDDTNVGDDGDQGIKIVPDLPQVSLDSNQFPQVVQLFSAIILFIATGAVYRWNFKNSYRGYALSISIIAMAVSLMNLVLLKLNKVNYLQYSNYLLFGYSFIGACFLTFDSPFTATSNGYFAAWVSVYGSVLSLGMKREGLGSTIKGLGSIIGLLASSIVVIIATIKPINDGNKSIVGGFRSEAIYALVLCCVTTLFTVVIMLMDKRGDTLNATMYFVILAALAVGWLVEACLVTFRGPFMDTGNGYFASWAGSFISAMAACIAKNDL